MINACDALPIMNAIVREKVRCTANKSLGIQSKAKTNRRLFSLSYTIYIVKNP